MYFAEDSPGKQFFLKFLFLLGGDHLQYDRATVSNHLHFHISLGNWFLCDVMASNRIPMFIANWSSGVELKGHVITM